MIELGIVIVLIYLGLKLHDGFRKLTEVELLIVSFVLVNVVLVLVMFLEGLLGIQIDEMVVKSNSILLAVLSTVYLITNKDRWNLVRLKINWKENGLILFLIVVSLYAKVYSVRYFNAPPLHDPSNHGKLVASYLADGEKFEGSWYPPGMTYLTANYYLIFKGFGWDIPKTILYLTNVANALLPITYLILFRYLGAGLLTSVLGFGFLFFNKMPMDLFMYAGKNSSILFETVLPVGLIFILATNRAWIWGAILLALWLIHFPQLLIIGFPLSLYLVWRNKKLEKKRFWVMSSILGLGVLGWILKVWPALSSSFFLVSNFSENSGGTIFGESLRSYLSWFYTDSKRYLEPFFIFWSIALGIVSLRRTRDNWRTILWMSYGVLIVLASYFLNKIGLSTIGVFATEEFYIIIPIILLLASVEFMGRVEGRIDIEFRSVVIISLIMLATGHAREVYWKYYQTMVFDVVTKEDLVAMRYFANSSRGTKVLVNNHSNGKVVAGSDAGMWLPTYYPNLTVVPSDFNSEIDWMANRTFNSIISDPINTETREQLVEMGVKYIYIGSKQVYSQFRDKNVLLEVSFLIRVYGGTGDGPVIYEVI